jgi:hypothetical protein
MKAPHLRRRQETSHMTDIKAVYLIIHELFGVIANGSGIHLVTPEVSECCPSDKGRKPPAHKGHTYKIARFKEGGWVGNDVMMERGRTYTLQGVPKTKAGAMGVPPYPEFSPFPRGTFPLRPKPDLHCDWRLPLPQKIHQVREVAIVSRPLFTGDPEGNAVEKELKAVSVLQVYQYDRDSSTPLQILDDQGKKVGLDYSPDKFTSSVNIHLWAQIEDESDMDPDAATKHSIHATKKLVGLFTGLHMEAHASVATNTFFETQLPIPDDIAFVELMTLAERFAMRAHQERPSPRCIGKTCGAAGNLFMKGS